MKDPPTGSPAGEPGGVRRRYYWREYASPLVRSAVFVLAVFAVGIVGYRIIGGDEYGWLDAVYMTVVALTTVGFSEVIDLSTSPWGRVFTTLLLLGGIGSILYFFSAFTAFFVEGHLYRFLWSRRMRKSIDRLSNHFIVCGGGHTGKHVLEELLTTGRKCVLIDNEEDQIAALQQRLGVDFPAVVGDATDDSTLVAAGIERATGLVATISNDKDNLIITVSARLLNNQLRIVSRCIDERVQGKISRAGADAVISPSLIGGLRLVSELVRPAAVSFLDQMLRESEGLRVESTRIRSGSELEGLSVATAKDRCPRDLLLVALRLTDGRWRYNPTEEEVLDPGMSMIYMCGPKARAVVEELARSGAS